MQSIKCLIVKNTDFKTSKRKIIMKNLIINWLFLAAFITAFTAVGFFAAKSSYNKCKVYSKNDMQAMRDCLNF